MDWVRTWVLQIAGVIILSAICDIIMTDGEMKKYVKPILGFVLVFAIIRPISALSNDKIKIDILQDSIGETAELSQALGEKQKIDIIRIYEQKLAGKIKECVKLKYNADAEIFVKTDNSEKYFGVIQQVRLKIKLKNGETINTESIRRYIKEEFDVEIDNIEVSIKEE